MQIRHDWTGVRQEFPTLPGKNYLNSCSLGLLSNRSREALTRYMDLWTELGAAAWYSEWMAEIGAVREGFASLINAAIDEIAVLPSISAALAAISSSLSLAIAYMYVRRDLVAELEPTVAGWFGNRDQFSFNPNEMVFRDDAARFETGTPSVAAVFTAAEGLRIVNELGPEAIRERTYELTARLVSRLKDEGFGLRVTEETERHASITMIEMEDPAAAVEELARRNIIVDHRPGAVRISPYFYNTQDDIDEVVEALREIRTALEP